MASRSKIERRLAALEASGGGGQPPAETRSQAELKRHLAALDRRMGARALAVAEARAERLVTADAAYCRKMMARLDRKHAGRERLEGFLHQHLAHLDRLMAPAHYLPYVERLCQRYGVDPRLTERFIGLAMKRTSGPLADVIVEEVGAAAIAPPAGPAK